MTYLDSCSVENHVKGLCSVVAMGCRLAERRGEGAISYLHQAPYY